MNDNTPRLQRNTLVEGTGGDATNPMKDYVDKLKLLADWFDMKYPAEPDDVQKDLREIALYLSTPTPISEEELEKKTWVLLLESRCVKIVIILVVKKN